MLYFAYGSNMNPARMTERGAHFSRREAAALRDYRLAFNKRARVGRLLAWGAANVIPAPGETVHGVLYDIAPEALTLLDPFEGYPEHYRRETIGVALADDSTVDAVTYIGQSKHLREGLRPTREYLEHLLAGRDLLPPEYVDFLSATETTD